VRRLFAFIDWVMELPDTLNDRFWDEVDAYQEEMHRPFVSIADRMGRVKGLLGVIESCLEVSSASIASHR
jgi:hypothetical protein